jgi:glycerol uptake facilitator protein
VDVPLIRRLLAEVAGTAILCLFGIGAAVAAGPSGLLIVALAHGLALAVAIYAFGAISGGHFNPTVTLALAVRGRLAWREVPAYVLAQLIGGVLGAAVVYAAYSSAAVTAGLGATAYGPAVTPVQALVAEAAGAFILVTAVYALAVSPDAPKGVHGLGIGLALATQIMVFGPLTGASVNLARTVGPDVVLSLAGGTVFWSQLLVYLVGPLVGGIVAALLYEVIGNVARRAAGTRAAEQV